VLDSARFTNYDAEKGFANVKVKAIAEDLAGTVYFGTDGQGVYVLQEGQPFREVEALSRKYVRAMERDKTGDLWIATAGMGLYKLNPADLSVTNYSVKDGLLHPRLTALHYDKTGRLWYATENNGIGYMENGKFSKPVFTANLFLRDKPTPLPVPSVVLPKMRKAIFGQEPVAKD
jgi:ligand-binding sensor domain-containing protein